MTSTSLPASLLTRWTNFWFRPVPPHSFALLRMLLGGVGLLSLAGLTPVELYWPLDGMVPLAGKLGWRAALEGAGLGGVAGWLAFGLLVLAFTAMTVGYRSNLAVLACFVGLVLQQYWNRLPLSSAHQLMQNLIFCLVWAETGRVWSVDSLRRSAAAEAEPDGDGVPVWPLWLMRFQIAVVYGTSGLWKFAYPTWRDGSAVYWSLNLNIFHRFPWPWPAAADPVFSLLTWGTLAFELLFPVLVWFRRLRPAVLIGGIALHIGLGLTLELGPFSLVMIAGYLAFLDPDRSPALMARWSEWFQRRGLLVEARHEVAGTPSREVEEVR